MLHTENHPSLPPPMNQSRTKGNDSEFFPSLSKHLGKSQARSQKRRVVLLRKNTTLLGFDENKKERSHCMVGRGSRDGDGKGVCVWRSAAGKTADLITRAPHVDGPASGRRNSYIGWLSKFFFFCSAEASQPDNASDSPRRLPALQKKKTTLR